MYNFIATLSLLLALSFASITAVVGRISVLLYAAGVIALLVIFWVFRKINFKIASNFQSETDKLEEKINLLSQEICEKKKITVLLPEKSKKIESLFEVSHELVELYNFQEILDFLLKSLCRLFPSAENIMLFTLHKSSLSLELSFKKEERIIKEKYGDIIEKWLLKHNQSLIIDDLLKDFRFDCNKIAAFRERKIRSLIASPVSVGDTLLGTVRIESNAPSTFSFDDSRLLRDMCDLSAVVLERATLFAKAEELAIRDSLTFLFIKSHFYKRVEEELKRADYKKSNLGIIMIDIDDFKSINDTYGHIVGDIILKRLSAVLIETVGSNGDIIARFGGEEFVVALVECNKERLIEVAQNIHNNTERAKVSFRRKNINFTVSLGAVLYPEDGLELNDLINRADQYLYKAKKEGKNRICFTGQ
ncbi:MAG: sensor domain-containing diguanylate cyclase [Candidatus Omnitrophica bacterium]|nr:sensor domain-containing diguanylate cyclase [Candidatus Omnitrophota bacterium]